MMNDKFKNKAREIVAIVMMMAKCKLYCNLCPGLSID